jgi:uncharacterized SAM-binding protein YcdF (DUF218 family)
MEFGALKPLLKALVLPPAGPLLLAALGLLLLWRGWRRLGQWLLGLGLAALWLLSCNAFALWLNDRLLQPPVATTATQLRAARVQAVLILGGGLNQNVAEYGGSVQPTRETADRIRYGVWLARQLQLPLAFAGGVGWLMAGNQATSEGEMARRFMLEQYGVAPRWVDDRSRDTVENALFASPLLRRDGIERIALVTHAWHMPRALAAFRRMGLQVVAAPMGYLRPQGPSWHEWLPSPGGLRHSYIVLHEWLGMLASPG